MKDFVPSSKIKVFQFVIIIAYFLQINSKLISNCTREDGLKTETCFNDLKDIKKFRQVNLQKIKAKICLCFIHISVQIHQMKLLDFFLI